MIGCAALGYCAFLWGRAEYDQLEGNRQVDQGHLPQVNVEKPLAAGTLIGRIRIPRLKLSAVIFEGTDDPTLARGVGHLSGSAVPGKIGNLVLAGHRDTFFSPLKNIREGDEIDVTGPEGAFRYLVESTEVVAPDATEVLRPTNSATLTLITCYPFRYIGNAPDRFIVRGKKVGVLDEDVTDSDGNLVSRAESSQRPRKLYR